MSENKGKLDALVEAAVDIIGPADDSDRFGYGAARNIMEDELRARLYNAVRDLGGLP